MFLGTDFLYPLPPNFYAQRTWTDREGKTTQASFVKAFPDTEEVCLKRPDGKTFTFSWKRLCHDDLAMIQEWIKEKENTVVKTLDNQSSPDPNILETASPLPNKWILRGVPMVVQKGGYCALACGEMIARYHKIKTDQDELASLCSEESENHQGTYSSDFSHAMKNLGFQCQYYYLGKITKETFQKIIFPEIRNFLFRKGPIYVGFKEGVFGNSGHACVLIGYDQRREKMFFHNPWGNKFEKTYQEIIEEIDALIFAFPRSKSEIDIALVETTLREALPRLPISFDSVIPDLSARSFSVELLLGNRRDAKSDNRHAQITARDEGRKFIEQGMRGASSLLIPQSTEGEMRSLLWIFEMKTRSCYRGYSITPLGWEKEPREYTLTQITRQWVTKMNNGDFDFPIILIHNINIKLL